MNDIIREDLKKIQYKNELIKDKDTRKRIENLKKQVIKLGIDYGKELFKQQKEGKIDYKSSILEMMYLPIEYNESVIEKQERFRKLSEENILGEFGLCPNKETFFQSMNRGDWGIEQKEENVKFLDDSLKERKIKKNVIYKKKFSNILKDIIYNHPDCYKDKSISEEVILSKGIKRPRKCTLSNDIKNPKITYRTVLENDLLFNDWAEATMQGYIKAYNDDNPFLKFISEK